MNDVQMTSFRSEISPVTAAPGPAVAVDVREVVSS